MNRKFNSDWLKEPDLKVWLVKRVDCNKKEYPKCLACDTTFINKKSTLLAHAKTEKHKEALTTLQEKQQQQRALQTFISDPLGSNVKSLELRICLLMAEKNLPISVGDDILKVFQHEIPNQPVLTRTSIGKTKASNLIREGLSLLFFKTNMLLDCSSCHSLYIHIE